MELMKRYPDNYFDLAIVDPPYGIKRFEKGLKKGDRLGSHFKGNLSFNNNTPTVEYFNELFRVSKNQIIWGANNFILPPTEYFCIWNKKQTVDNFATAEYAWVSMGLKSPSKMFDYSIHKHNATERNKLHPTQKPVALYKWLLDKYAKKGDKILDTHGGSLSIAVACHDYDFELTACEIDKEYYVKSIERIKNHVSQQKLF